ncbi:MAG: hypothetical protein M3Y59_09605 [Myxococcota bacterium]|nr:hypothetical protein [Myxococcota bacterium]
MKVVSIYLRIYADCLKKAVQAIGKNLWTLLLPVGLAVALTFASTIIGNLGLGLVGGILMGLVLIALYSSYLYFVAGLVMSGRVHISELKGSFGRLFWPVMGVSFVVWIANLLVSLLAGSTAQGAAIQTLFALVVALAVFINPTPEVIYDRGSHSGMATLQKSFAFTQDNWIEWYLPNLLLGGLGYLVFRYMGALGYGGLVVLALVAGSFLHLVMVFRGHLYRALDGSSHRQRMFKYRNAE